MVGATVSTVAGCNQYNTPCPKRQGFFVIADPMGVPSGTPNDMKVYKSIPTRDKYLQIIIFCARI